MQFFKTSNAIFSSLIIGVIGFSLGFIISEIAHHNISNRNIALVKKSFDIFNGDNMEEEIAKYHSKDYVQHSDGKTLDYNQFLKHIEHVKSVIAPPLEITYDTVIAEGGMVCTSHRAKATKKDGSKVEIKVIAIHKIKNGKIYQTDELSHLITGAKEDKELGSKH